MTHTWVYQIGQVAASVYGGAQGSAFYSAYYNYQATGSLSAATKAGVIALSDVS